MQYNSDFNISDSMQTHKRCLYDFMDVVSNIIGSRKLIKNKDDTAFPMHAHNLIVNLLIIVLLINILCTYIE